MYFVASSYLQMSEGRRLFQLSTIDQLIGLFACFCLRTITNSNSQPYIYTRVRIRMSHTHNIIDHDHDRTFCNYKLTRPYVGTTNTELCIQINDDCTVYWKYLYGRWSLTLPHVYMRVRFPSQFSSGCQVSLSRSFLV
jgi:hypothetical protein